MVGLSYDCSLQQPDRFQLSPVTESIDITTPERSNEKLKTFRSTYDFRSPRRYKSVVYLAPRLAPFRYWRKINFGVISDLRHKSGVDCAYRPRPSNFSETAWIFPQQGSDNFTSQLDAQLLVDTRWYRTRVNHPNEIEMLNAGNYDNGLDLNNNREEKRVDKRWNSVESDTCSEISAAHD